MQSIFANITAIDLNQLPSNAEFKKEITWIIQSQNMVAVFWPKWDFPTPKTEVVDRLKKLVGQTNEFIKADAKNIDLLLFRVILYHYLYNLDLREYDDTIMSEANRIKKIFPDEYRIYWLLGHHFDRHGLALKSIKEFDYAVKNTKEDRLAAYFWYDYADALGRADMLKHGINALEKCAGIEKRFRIESNELYKDLSDHFMIPSFDKEISKSDIYTFQERENTSGILCRLFGVFMPIKKSWNLQLFEIINNESMVIFTPESLPNKDNKRIKYSMQVGYKANNKVSFDEFVENSLSRYSSYKKRNMTIGKYPFRIYEMTDPNTYKDMGGAHGFLLLLSRKAPNVKGLDIEGPIVSFMDDDSNKQYTHPVKEYDRYDGEIYYSVFLDCCEDIFAKASEVFKTFAGDMLFD
jgi:hypothetical protein